MINSRKIEDLEGLVQKVCKEHIRLAKEEGSIDLLVTSTYRDLEAQSALWSIGRTTELTRKIVTKAKPGQSWHNYRCAYDVVPLLYGKPVWDSESPVWDLVILYGLKAGAERGPKWDKPHFQVIPKHDDNKSIDLVVAANRWNKFGSIFIGDSV